MKKSLVVIAIFSLLLTAGSLVLAQETSEKIPSPNEIKNYTQITRVGNSLYGVRIQNKVSTETSLKLEKANLSVNNLKLEKIAHPQEINLFEKIQKIGSALWGVKKNTVDSESNNQNKKTVEVKPVKLPEVKPIRKIEVKPELVACVKTAIEDKDVALKAALTEYNQGIFTAIDARTTCQKAAIDQAVSEQGQANRLCVEAYQKAISDNRKTFQNYKDINWQAYRDDLKICQTTTANTVSMEELIIEDGEGSLE